ncbi:MAG: DUF2752 domain-containing protein [Turicibacter sp.]
MVGLSRRHFGVVRLCVYLCSLILIYSVNLSSLDGRSFCWLYNVLNFKCLGCGMTHAFLNFMHFNFTEAITHNGFILIIGPIGVALVLEDVLKCGMRLVNSKFGINRSVIETMFFLIK